MGASPIFYLHSMHEGVQVSSKLEQLQALLAPVVEGLGYQCWGIEYVSQGKHSVLRIYICLLYTSPSPRDQRGSRMPSSA